MEIAVDPSLDSELEAYLIECAVVTGEEFAKQAFPTPIRVERAAELTDLPEFRPQTADGTPRIFVTRQADPYQARLQVGHEVFHWVCTPPYLFHWVHEMFAQEMSIRGLRRNALEEYARKCEVHFCQGAEPYSLDQMLSDQLKPPYPKGLQERVFVVGRDLIAAIGWDALKPLASRFDSAGRPDVPDWLSSLSRAHREAAEAMLASRNDA